MRKKLVVLFCVLMALSTALFAVSMVSTGANASFSYTDWTLTFDKFAPNVNDETEISATVTNIGNSVLKNIEKTNSNAFAMNTAEKGAFLRLTSTVTDGTYMRFSGDFNGAGYGLTTYHFKLVLQMSDTVHSKGSPDFRFRLVGKSNNRDAALWSSFESAEADENGWKTIEFDVTPRAAAEYVTGFHLLMYFGEGSVVDIKSISMSTPITMPSVSDPVSGSVTSKVDFESFADNTAISTSQKAIPANSLPAEIGGGFASVIRYGGASWQIVNGAGTADAFAEGKAASAGTENFAIFFNSTIPNSTTYTVTVKIRMRNTDGSAYDPDGSNTITFGTANTINLRLRTGTTVKQTVNIWSDFIAATPDEDGFVTITKELTTGDSDNCDNVNLCAYIQNGKGFFDINEVTISASVNIPGLPVAGERIIDFTAYNDTLTTEGSFVNVPTTEKGDVVVDAESAGAKVGLEGADQYYFLRLGADADAASVAVKLNINLIYGRYNLKMKVRPSENYVSNTAAYLRFWNATENVAYTSGEAGYFGKTPITSYIDALTVDTWNDVTIPFTTVNGLMVSHIELTFTNGNSATNYIDIDDIYVEQVAFAGNTILGTETTLATTLANAQSDVYVTGSAIALDALGINAPEGATITNLAAVGGYDYTAIGTHEVDVTLAAESGYAFVVGSGDELREGSVITVRASFEISDHVLFFKHNGEVLSSLTSNADGYVLPDANIGANKYLLGWYGEIAGDNIFLPAGYNLTTLGTLTENVELEGLFATINTLTGASVKFGDIRTGLKFETEYELENTDFAANVLMYTLLSPKDYVDKATDFTKDALETANEGVEGAIYLEVMSNTINTSDNGLYEYYSASYVNIKPYNYARQISARGFLKVTYSDDSEGIIYGTFDAVNNSRSVYEVAIAAYKDRATAEDDVYKYEPDVIDETTYYSRYTAEQLAILKMYIDGVVNIELSGDDYVPVNPLGDTGYNKYVAPYTVAFEDGVITLSDNGEVEGDWSYYTSMRGSYYRASVIIDGERKTKRSEDFTVSVDETKTVGDIVNTITKN